MWDHVPRAVYYAADLGEGNCDENIRQQCTRAVCGGSIRVGGSIRGGGGSSVGRTVGVNTGGGGRGGGKCGGGDGVENGT